MENMKTKKDNLQSIYINGYMKVPYSFLIDIWELERIAIMKTIEEEMKKEDEALDKEIKNHESKL